MPVSGETISICRDSGRKFNLDFDVLAILLMDSIASQSLCAVTSLEYPMSVSNFGMPIGSSTICLRKTS